MFDVHFAVRRPCSGQVLNIQDVQCTYCQSCLEGQYISKRCPGGNVLQTDTHNCSSCRASCEQGYYMATRCDGSTFSDVVQCKPCRMQCPDGQYMRSVCSGMDDANDCVACTPCSAGQYMSSGACANGTAKSPSQRTCSACKACPAGKYVAAGTACDGSAVQDTVRCMPCSSCARGFYISQQCSSTGTSPAPQQCTACRTCPPGFYRTGCMGNTFYDDVQCVACPNCTQVRCFVFRLRFKTK